MTLVVSRERHTAIHKALKIEILSESVYYSISLLNNFSLKKKIAGRKNLVKLYFWISIAMREISRLSEWKWVFSTQLLFLEWDSEWSEI